MAEETEGFGPFPAATEPVGPADELRLQEALALRESITVDVAPPAPLGRAPAFDFVARRFVPNVAGGPLMTRGDATLGTWIEKCMRTRLAAHPAVDPTFGCEMLAEDVLSEGEPFDEAVLAEWADAVRRALIQHPRIVDVVDIEFDQIEEDAVAVSMRVLKDDDDGEVDELPYELFLEGS